MVKYLLTRNPSLLDGRATGNFFKEGKPCYYGEFPVCFAACTNQKDIVQFLVEEGADLSVQDSNGNTVLHLLVLHELVEMYNFILETFCMRIPQLANLQKIENANRLTPFTLAASMGQKTIFSYILEKRKLVQWIYGPVTCNLYPLDELDYSILPNGTFKKGALQWIMEKEQTNLLMHPRIIDLLTKKWNRFAEKEFWRRLIMTLIYLFVFTVTITMRHQFWFQVVGESFVLLGALWKARREVSQMIRDGLYDYFSGSGSLLVENCLSSTFCLLIFLIIPFRYFNSPLENILLAFAALCGWSYLLFYFMGLRATGTFVIMIYHMLVGDFLRFTVLYLVFLMAFSEAFFVLQGQQGFMQLGYFIKLAFYQLWEMWNWMS
jgi:hypothetical protein